MFPLYILVTNQARHLKPGGYIEHVEISPVFRSKRGEIHPSLKRFSSELISAGKKNGKTMEVSDTMNTLIKEAGFTNTVSFFHEVPFGSWAEGRDQKYLGISNLAQFLQGLDGFVLRPFTGVLKVGRIHCLLTSLANELVRLCHYKKVS